MNAVKGRMSLKEYFGILYKIFFKAMSFEEEVESWRFIKYLDNTYLIINYSALISLLIILIRYTIQYLNNIFDIQQFALGVTYGVIFSIGSILILGIVFNKASGLIFGIAFWLTYIFFYILSPEFSFSIPFSIAFGITFGNRIGANDGIGFSSLAIGILCGLSEGIIAGFISVIVYFIITTRYFYYPVYLLVTCSNFKHPLWWDENISSPVPFFPNLLLRYARQEGVTQTVVFASFLINERPAQVEILKKGLARLAIFSMANFSHVRQIAFFQQELDFVPIPEELPNDYKNFLKDIADISSDTRLAFIEKDSTTKLRQYHHIELRIINLQETLNFSGKSSYKKFRLASGRWLQIIRWEIKRLEQLHGKPLPNPFITGNPVRPEDEEVFVGRQDIIREIQTEALREGAGGAILFMGNRRTGKSSTLLNLNRFLSSSLQAVYFDCQYPKINESLPNFCQHVASEIYSKIPKLKKKALPKDLAALTDWLEAAEEELKTNQRYMLLCFDEYERLGTRITDGTLRGLPDALRSWVQRFRRFIFLFAGSHELRDVREVDWTDYLINVRTVYISYLDEPAALHLVTKPVPEFDLQYQPDTLPNQLIQRLGRQPYLLQCTLSEMVENLNNDNNRKFAEPKDIDRAVTQVFTTAQQYFEHFWEKELEPEAREVLLRLAKGKTVETDTAAAKRLVKKEVLKRVDGSLVFCMPVLKEWIGENY